MKSVLILLSLAFTLCAADKIQIARDGAQWSVTVSGSLPPQSPVRIAASGDLTVRGKSSEAIRYTVTRKLPFGDEATARLLAATLHPRRIAGQIIFDQPGAVYVELPRASAFLALASAAGMVDAADIDGSVRADTVAGKVALDRIAGGVEIHSGGGATSLGSIGGIVRCYSGGGPIRAILIRGQSLFETDGGDIHLGQVLGAVRAVTAGGEIRIDQAGAQVYAVTEGGNIIAGILAGHPPRDSFLSTRGGDITVFIPSDTGVTIEAETDGSYDWRSVISDYSGLRIVSRASSVVATGKINGGGALLRLNGRGGRIEIKRK